MSRRLAAPVLVLALLVLACGQREATIGVKTQGDRVLVVPSAELARPGVDGVDGLGAVAAERAAERRRRELKRLRRSRTVAAALRAAYLAGALARVDYVRMRADLLAAQEAARVLRGAQGDGQRAALALVSGLARDRLLTSRRLRPAFEQLRRNTAWWTRRGLPAGARDVRWGADPITLRWVPGSGLVIHPLASWGAVNALAGGCVRQRRACPRTRLRGALDRLLALGVPRGGGLAWEHLFPWGGGRPGWVSAMVQGTAVQALARGAVALGDERYDLEARRALVLFTRRPPVGVAVPEGRGRHYLMYSFDPSLRILNGFLQSLVGLRDAADLSESLRARRLYRRGDRAARAALRAADTGAWSLYSAGGRESTLHYHRLTGGFLTELCRRTRTGAYCAARERFARYEREPPRIALAVRRRPRAGEAVRVRFRLSKVSKVAVSVRGPRGVELSRVLRLPRGRHVVSWRPARRGRASVLVRARGPSGPEGRARATVRVRRSWAAVRAARRQAAERRARAARRERAAQRRRAAARRRALREAARRGSARRRDPAPASRR